MQLPSQSSSPHSSQSSIVLTVLTLFTLAILLAPAGVEAQYRSAPVDPDVWNEHLEIGPVPGLTSTWHSAPLETGAPLHDTLRLRIRVPQMTDVVWEGAHEMERTRSHSIAEVRLDAVGQHTVRVTWTHPNSEPRSETLVLQGVDTSIQPVELSPIRPSVDTVEIDPANPNASTMKYFFRPDSIAPLVEVAPDHYRTSVNRWVTFAVDVQPAELAPLVEWSLDGEAQRHLGAQVRMLVYGAQEHTVLAGGDGLWSPQLRLDTYSVKITEDTRDQRIVDGVPVTYRAETDPPGFENEVAWLASTKYGTCSPDRGFGPEFTTEFQGTVGDRGRWVGVRAANAALASDNKGISGIFRGDLVTDEVTGTLVLDLREQSDCVAGTWTIVGDAEEVFGSGLAIGDRSGQNVSIELESLPNTVLVGAVSAAGDAITGTLEENGIPIAPVVVLACFGPNLVFDLSSLTTFPPASLCKVQGNGNTVVVRNLGPGDAPATNVRGTLNCVGPLNFTDNNNPIPALAEGETHTLVLNIPEECTTILDISITIDPVPGECNPDNTRESTCFSPVG